MWDKANFVIELKKVNLSYNKQIVVSGIDFNLRAAETVYLFGPNGSGKSSLLKLLYGALAMGDGEGRVFDYELNKPDRERLPFLRRQLGILNAEFSLIEDINIEDNLALILHATDWLDGELRKERISEVLNLVDLNSKASFYPKEISKAEYRKVMFARAILNNPAILLLDEPVAELDKESAMELLHIIFKYVSSKKIAMVFSTNNIEIVTNFPATQFKMEKGKTSLIPVLPFKK
jgi:cell division transport system ATP-binding protein